jgi:uncharacterized protein YkwD
MSLGRSWVQRLGVPALVLALAAPVSTSAEHQRLDVTESGALLGAMNEHRQRRGLRPLHRSTRLEAAAADRIRDMFAQRYFDHVAPDGTQPFSWARHHGYSYAALGENLATGQRRAEAAVEQWMRSPGHRANIMGDFEDAGIAIASGSPTWRSDGYTFVVLYGRERGSTRLVRRR